MTDFHPDLEEGIDLIDASFFSGDSFRSKDNLAEIEKYLGRWNREVVRIKEDHMDNIVLFILIGCFDQAVDKGLYTMDDLPMSSGDAFEGIKKANEATKRLVEQGYVDQLENKSYWANQAGCDWAEELINGS